MEKDLAFLAFIQSDEYENAEEFIKVVNKFINLLDIGLFLDSRIIL